MQRVDRGPSGAMLAIVVSVDAPGRLARRALTR